MDGQCFYCGSKSERYEMDHFPIPARHGGRDVVRACVHCHNMKDRISESVFWDYFSTQGKLDDYVLSAGELRFLFQGQACAKAAWYLISDLPDFDAPLRLLIARRVASALDGGLVL